MTLAAFHMIAALDEEKGIGRDGDLPWRLPGDMAYFMRVTLETETDGEENVVIMGRRTWDSIPERYRPLERRKNIVLTRNPEFQAPPGVTVAHSLEEALEWAEKMGPSPSVFVIGGGAIYREGMEHSSCQRLYLTQVEGAFDCDTQFPPYEDDFELVSTSERFEENGIGYRFCVFHRLNATEDGGRGV